MRTLGEGEGKERNGQGGSGREFVQLCAWLGGEGKEWKNRKSPYYPISYDLDSKVEAIC